MSLKKTQGSISLRLMIDFAFAILLLLIVLLAIELRKSYHLLPKSELKYRAAHGDQLAEKLYRAAAYGSTLDVFLWIVIIFGSAGGLVLFNVVAPLWLSFIAIVLLLWLGFAWLPKAKVSKFTTKLVIFVTPPLASILNYLHPSVKRAYRLTRSDFEKANHTGVYDKKGLSELIDKQKAQQDNRISEQELNIIKKSIDLFDTKVSDVCLPWSKVKKITIIDPVGPILLDELHKSDQLLIPVTEDKGSKEIVGILNLNKLNITSKGIVSDSMDSTVYYLNEDDTLDNALKSFATTNYPLFIVVDDTEHYVGVLTFSSVVAELLGHVPEDSFEQFASLSVVAGKYRPSDSSEDDQTA
jgi:CBS domain containing-hemolysin-like protein